VSSSMLLVGLTGGIGSGKSTVGALLAGRGAVLIDADQIAREVVAPGGVAYEQVVARFGPGVVAADDTLDRAALAEVVFRDAAARKDLEAITHPAVGGVIIERLASHAGFDGVVILDIPLLAEKGRMGVEHIVVVDCPEEVAVARLVATRGFDEGDARRRVAAQISRTDRLALADLVVDNSRSREDLVARVDEVWKWLDDIRAGHPSAQ
jgi:dephospho-CoA kinase